MKVREGEADGENKARRRTKQPRVSTGSERQKGPATNPGLLVKREHTHTHKHKRTHARTWHLLWLLWRLR